MRKVRWCQRLGPSGGIDLFKLFVYEGLDFFALGVQVAHGSEKLPPGQGSAECFPLGGKPILQDARDKVLKTEAMLGCFGLGLLEELVGNIEGCCHRFKLRAGAALSNPETGNESSYIPRKVGRWVNSGLRDSGVKGLRN